ncbi:MAG: phage portal protein [Proteobacteria bacterium]|nr:phage portal protein [Pseudomonadota bacterium]
MPVAPTLGARLAASLSRFTRRAPEALPAPADTKSSRVGPLIAFEYLRQPVWTPRDYQAFATEGFMQNAIVYRAIRMISECVGTIPLRLYDGDVEIESHPLLDLIDKPNGHQVWPDFVQSLVGYLLVSGNAYIEAVSADRAGAVSAPEAQPIRELYTLRPDRIKVIAGADGWPDAYDYTVNGRTVRIEGEVVPQARDGSAPGIRAILHVKLFHPANDYYGASPLEAAASAIDLHNTASKWNKSLLDNSARPSGAIVYTARDGNLTAEQIERLKSELEDGFQGAANAGRPLLLEGGLDWKAMSLSPKDMDFIETRHVAAREIALALGVPPMLLGIPGDNTFSNFAEAQRMFWRSTVLPLAERLAKALSMWLAPAYAPDAVWASEGASKELSLRPDTDNLPALASERDALWTALNAATFLSTDEKRALAGFSPAPPAAKFNPYHDAIGRFTTADGVGQAPDGTPVVPAGERVDRYRVDLLEEEQAGGHTLSKHVGETPQTLLARVRATIAEGDDPLKRDIRSGTFPSAEAAGKLVDSTLAQNKTVVDAVAEGRLREVRVDAMFTSQTGFEAYAPNTRSQPTIRDTYGVGVFIRHDPDTARGYRVISAYPRNLN